MCMPVERHRDAVDQHIRGSLDDFAVAGQLADETVALVGDLRPVTPAQSYVVNQLWRRRHIDHNRQN